MSERNGSRAFCCGCGEEYFVYAINSVAYKGCRVEVAGFRSNTAPRLIDIADFSTDLDDIAEFIRNDLTQPGDYDVPSFVPPDETPMPDIHRSNGRERIASSVAVEPDFTGMVTIKWADSSA